MILLSHRLIHEPNLNQNALNHNITIRTTFFSHNHDNILIQYWLQLEVTLNQPSCTHNAQTIAFLGTHDRSSINSHKLGGTCRTAKKLQLHQDTTSSIISEIKSAQASYPTKRYHRIGKPDLPLGIHPQKWRHVGRGGESSKSCLKHKNARNHSRITHDTPSIVLISNISIHLTLSLWFLATHNQFI